MPIDNKLPPPDKGGMRGPEMRQDRPDLMGKISSLAGMGGDQMSGGGGEEQAAQMVMQAAQMLMQAAQMVPGLKPAIDQAMGVLQQGVQQIAGGAGEEAGMGGEMKPPKKRKAKPPKPQDNGEDEGMDGMMGGGY